MSGVEGHVIEPVDGSIPSGQGQHFNKLDCAEVVTDAGGILRVWSLYPTEIIHVEMFRLGRVRAIDANMGYPADRRPAGRGLRERINCGYQSYRGKHSKFRVLHRK